MHPGFQARRPAKPMSFRRAYYFSTILAAVPVMLISLQSVGSVTWYEAVLVIVFAALGCLYISKRI